MRKRYKLRRPLTTVKEIMVLNTQTIFLRENRLSNETDYEATIRLHKELSKLLSLKHSRPLDSDEMKRFKALTVGLGKA